MSQITSATAQITCGFCKGAGKDPFDLLSGHAACQVCGGTGNVEVVKPVIKCAFCKGSGVYHNTRITCTVCNGKGVVTAPQSPTEWCPECEGTGTIIDSGMTCLGCKGKGVVSK